jgi:hypothetical protein
LGEIDSPAVLAGPDGSAAHLASGHEAPRARDRLEKQNNAGRTGMAVLGWFGVAAMTAAEGA